MNIKYYILINMIRILLVSGLLLLRRCRRNLRPVRVRFVVGKVTPQQLFLRVLQFSPVNIYRVIHKPLRDFRTRLRNNQDRHGEMSISIGRESL